MSKIRKRTEITIDTQSLIIFRTGAESLRTWCEQCGHESVLLTTEAAAKLGGVTTSVIHSRIEAGSLHYTELTDGALLICAPSIVLNQL